MNASRRPAIRDRDALSRRIISRPPGRRLPVNRGVIAFARLGTLGAYTQERGVKAACVTKMSRFSKMPPWITRVLKITSRHIAGIGYNAEATVIVRASNNARSIIANV